MIIAHVFPLKEKLEIDENFEYFLNWIELSYYRGVIMAKKAKNLLEEVAFESDKTKRAREKLRKQLEVADSQITDQAIDQKKAEIERWIERNTKNRSVLKSKAISLFDENQNPAKESSKIEQMSKDLEKELSHS